MPRRYYAGRRQTRSSRAAHRRRCARVRSTGRLPARAPRRRSATPHRRSLRCAQHARQSVRSGRLRCRHRRPSRRPSSTRRPSPSLTRRRLHRRGLRMRFAPRRRTRLWRRWSTAQFRHRASCARRGRRSCGRWRPARRDRCRTRDGRPRVPARRWSVARSARARSSSRAAPRLPAGAGCRRRCARSPRARTLRTRRQTPRAACRQTVRGARSPRPCACRPCRAARQSSGRRCSRRRCCRRRRRSRCHSRFRCRLLTFQRCFLGCWLVGVCGRTHALKLCDAAVCRAHMLYRLRPFVPGRCYCRHAHARVSIRRLARCVVLWAHRVA